ncbi:hypothetical protein [Streptoalloteichus hindustanus]|uniref:Uncharacterized protein n=1 Tax=Streptoalloteichus hindustanus TaxID=2017 RepID=A0A1M5IB07_STRHI|nr:hypothetical protein [Streptoalloteichus hindustanus]SHG25544.1 hypothetical protein SAMN05444320_107206 [Streptoalloteichus hindustanus]
MPAQRVGERVAEGVVDAVDVQQGRYLGLAAEPALALGGVEDQVRARAGDQRRGEVADSAHQLAPVAEFDQPRER